MTILFCDVTGSTGLGERLDPERLQELLAIYFGAMREEIEAEAGTVEKFIGDAVMAAFGVPAAHEDDPSRALRAALRMRERLTQVNAEIEPRFGVTLRVRMGVNTGEVLAATSPQPGDPMVTGDPVNVAARLEQSAEPGQIVVAERTARAARGFRFHELGAQDLRGKEQPVPAVVLEERTSGVAERGVPGLRAPMVGRDAELELLRSVYQRSVAEARPNLVTIYGDPGVGKSRLTAEFVAWAEEQVPEPRILRGRCLPYGDGVTYWPLAEILKDLANVRDSDPPETALERIRAFGRELVTGDMSTNPAKAIAALGYSIGVEDPDFGFRTAEPREVRLKIHAAWRSLLSALAARGPVVAVVDDIHWADPALLDLLEELADRVVGPVVYLCPARPQLTERRSGWGGGRRNVSSIALEPLTSEESNTLVGFLLTIDDLPASVRGTILERAEGNPFFIEEIVRHLIDEGAIVREADRWRAATNIVDVRIPDTIQAVLAARIDLLEPVEKRALQRAAVVGRVFWPGPVGRLLNGDRDRLRDTLDRLEERELVLSRLSSSIAGEQEFIFKHILTREVAYESLPRRERAVAHASVATWIEETAGDRSREFLELLAYHYLEAYRAARDDAAPPETEELRRRAFTAVLGVAEESRARFAQGKATAMAEKGLGLASGPLERIEALEKIGLIALNDYQGNRSWSSFKEAIDLRLEQTPDERRAIARTCARALETPLRWPGSMTAAPDIDEVKRYLEIGFQHVDDEDSEEAVRLLTLRAFEPFGFGWRIAIDAEEREIAERSGLRAAEIARRIERMDLESAALDGASSVPLNVGLYGRTSRLIERRLEIAQQIEDPWEIGDIFGMGAWHHSLIGRYEESIRLGLLGRSRTVDEARGPGGHCLNWAGASLFHRGEWDRVLEVFAESRALLGGRADDPPYFMMNVYGAAAFVHDARALPGADELLDLLHRARGSIHGGTVMASYWLAWALARRGEHEHAWEQIRTAHVESMTMRPFQDQVTAELLAETGRWEDAPALVRDGRAYASDAELLALPVHLDRLEGRAKVVAGDLEGGLKQLGAARDGFAGLGAAWERARTELDRAEALLMVGRRQEVRAALEAATPDIERVGALSEIERSRNLRARLD